MKTHRRPSRVRNTSPNRVTPPCRQRRVPRAFAWRIFRPWGLFLCIALTAGCASGGVQKVLRAKDAEFRVRYTHYAAKKREPLPRTVIILPPTGGPTFLEKSYAKGLSQKGAEVFIVQRWDGMEEVSLDYEVHQRLHERALRSIQLLMKSAPKDHKISLMGTSLGGIYTAVAASDISSIDRVLAIAAGVPIAQVIADSQHPSMTQLQQRRIEGGLLTDPTNYPVHIAKVFDLEPTKLPPRFRQIRRAQVILLDDKAVPTIYQRELEKLWNPQKVWTVDASHTTGILKTWWFYSDAIENFLIGVDDRDSDVDIVETAP